MKSSSISPTFYTLYNYTYIQAHHGTRSMATASSYIYHIVATIIKTATTIELTIPICYILLYDTRARQMWSVEFHWPQVKPLLCGHRKLLSEQSSYMYNTTHTDTRIIQAYTLYIHIYLHTLIHHTYM